MLRSFADPDFGEGDGAATERNIIHMKRTKRIFSLLLALAFCFTLSLPLFSCDGGEKPNNGDVTPPTPTTDVTYSFTVTDKDGAAIPGVKVMFSDGSSIFQNAETGADGKASVKFDAEKTGLGIMIVSVPAGYEKPEPTSGVFHAMFGSEKALSMQLQKPTAETITYTVKVVDQNGNAVANAEVQICHTVCVQCDLTDANGETKKVLSASVSAGTLKVGVLGLPEGYTIPEATVEGGYHATIAPGETAVVVEVIKN